MHSLHHWKKLPHKQVRARTGNSVDNPPIFKKAQLISRAVYIAIATGGDLTHIAHWKQTKNPPKAAVLQLLVKLQHAHAVFSTVILSWYIHIYISELLKQNSYKYRFPLDSERILKPIQSRAPISDSAFPWVLQTAIARKSLFICVTWLYSSGRGPCTIPT